MSHTPNEWYACRHEHGDGECYRIDIRGNQYRSLNGQIQGSEPICSLYAGFVHFEGNATLIIAAPELLAVLKAAEKALRSYQYGNSSPELAEEIADAASKAIANAEGE